MRRTIFITALALITLSSFMCAAQDTKKDDGEKKIPFIRKVFYFNPDIKPVKHVFSTLTLINGQTSEILGKKTLQFEIQHRFGKFTEMGVKDLFGIFGAANIRLGLNYGITDKLMVGIGGTKGKHLYDLQWKYQILRQAKKGSDRPMPITLTYYGDWQVNTSEDPTLSFVNRLGFFHELMVSRKFGKKLSFQIGASYTHYNIVDTIRYSDLRHDHFNLSAIGRFNFSPQSSVIIEYNQPLTASKDLNNRPDLGLGVEISTGGHAFDIFITTANGINNAENAVYNINDFTKGDIMLGFNISRKWRF